MSVLSSRPFAVWRAARTWVAGGKNLKLEKFEVEVEEEKKKRRQFLAGHVDARGEEDEVTIRYNNVKD